MLLNNAQFSCRNSPDPFHSVCGDLDQNPGAYIKRLAPMDQAAHNNLAVRQMPFYLHDSKCGKANSTQLKSLRDFVLLRRSELTMCAILLQRWTSLIDVLQVYRKVLFLGYWPSQFAFTVLLSVGQSGKRNIVSAESGLMPQSQWSSSMLMS